MSVKNISNTNKVFRKPVDVDLLCSSNRGMAKEFTDFGDRNATPEQFSSEVMPQSVRSEFSNLCLFCKFFAKSVTILIAL